MAFIMAIQKWRLYLLRQRFIIQTDQSSFKFILDQRLVASEYQKLMTKLMGYDFEVVYTLGIENTVADALSRLPNTMEFDVVSLVGG